MAIVTIKDYFNAGNFKRVEIGDQVEWNGSKGHVVSLGTKFVEVLFYPGETLKGRNKIDPFRPTLVWLGTQHA